MRWIQLGSASTNRRKIEFERAYNIFIYFRKLRNAHPVSLLHSIQHVLFRLNILYLACWRFDYWDKAFQLRDHRKLRDYREGPIRDNVELRDSRQSDSGERVHWSERARRKTMSNSMAGGASVDIADWGEKRPSLSLFSSIFGRMWLLIERCWFDADNFLVSDIISFIHYSFIPSGHQITFELTRDGCGYRWFTVVNQSELSDISYVWSRSSYVSISQVRWNARLVNTLVNCALASFHQLSFLTYPLTHHRYSIGFSVCDDICSEQLR